MRALWLAEGRVCMRVCKHSCDVKMFCFSRANHVSTNFKKFLTSKLDKVTLFTHCFVGWNLQNLYNQAVSPFFRLSWQLSKPSSRVCITVSNSPNPSRVYIRLCKHGKRFLLPLNCSTLSYLESGGLVFLANSTWVRYLVLVFCPTREAVKPELLTITMKSFLSSFLGSLVKTFSCDGFQVTPVFLE